MTSSDSLTYRIATVSDCDSLALFINSSYEGELASQGWTNVNHLIEGTRTNVGQLSKSVNSNRSIIWMFFDKIEGILVGCVNLRHEVDSQTAHLTMLTVRPDLQMKGYGKMILSTGEKYCIDQWNVHFIEMTVIDQRHGLLAYYNRRGYLDTGRREPFIPSKTYQLKRSNLQNCLLRKCV